MNFILMPVESHLGVDYADRDFAAACYHNYFYTAGFLTFCPLFKYLHHACFAK